MTTYDRLAAMRSYFAARGYTCAPGLLEKYYLSLRCRPFLLLMGHTDTDLSLLPRLFAEAAGAAQRFCCLQVRPDWMDFSDLFGYVNLNGTFVPGAIIDFVSAAQSDPDHPYFLCLDRLIFSRVEYYLAEILAPMEAREEPDSQPGCLLTPAYYKEDTAACAKYGTLCMPDNLYLIGTVNLDETAFPLNQRFLDRVYALEVGPQDLTCEVQRPACAPEILPNSFLRPAQLRAEWDPAAGEWTAGCLAAFDHANRILMQGNAFVSYRLRNDGARFFVHSQQTGVLTAQEAMDHIICQKILTRVQGSARSVGEVLQALTQWCAQQGWPRAAEKAAQMYAGCQQDGFACYWL